MNLDLLKKLTKLANNNPNEHEANSAARRVCRMLEEANWSLTVSKTSNIDAMRNGTWEGFRRPEPTVQTWNDVKRSPEPEFRSSRPPFAGEPIFTQEMYEELLRRAKAQQSRMNQEDFKRRYYNGMYWDNPIKNEPLNNARRNRGFDPLDKKLLKCSKCGKEKMTGFVGRPEVFICQECVWSSF